MPCPRFVRRLRGVGRFRRVAFGRNDYKAILKNPGLGRMLKESQRESERGEGIRMSLAEFRAWLRDDVKGS